MNPNKNDCLDCINCMTKGIYTDHPYWICESTGKILGKTLSDIKILERDCENFECPE